MSDQTAPTYLEPIRDELDRLRTGWRAVTSALGYGDGITEPQIGFADFLAECEGRFAESAEWHESQSWRIECHIAGHPDDEDCFEHDPAMRLVAAEERLEQAEQRINDLMTRLDDRSAALNRTGASNDTMRAQIEAVRALHRERKILEDCPTDGCDRDDCAEGDEAGIALHWNDVVDRVCAECNDGYEDAISWPCPTVSALADQETA